jgi:hypothetical protein
MKEICSIVGLKDLYLLHEGFACLLLLWVRSLHPLLLNVEAAAFEVLGNCLLIAYFVFNTG